MQWEGELTVKLFLNLQKREVDPWITQQPCQLKMDWKKLFSIPGAFTPQKRSLIHKKGSVIFFYCPDKLGQTHDSVCSRTETGLKVLVYFLLYYKQPSLPPALGQSKKSGTFRRVTKKGMVCLPCFWCRSTSRKEVFHVTFQWWRWKASELLGLYVMFCTHFSLFSVQIKWKKFYKWVLKRSESESCGLKSQRWLKLISSLSLDSVTTVDFSSCQASLSGKQR